MKSNKKGLSIEERLMFIIIGVILILAIGVLTINNLSA